MYNKYKEQYTYDDTQKKATVIYSAYNISNQAFEEQGKIIYGLDKYGRINYDSYEAFPVKHAVVYDDKFSDKGVVTYDAQGNRTLAYEIRSDWQGDYYVSDYREYSYVYY